jgi:hypothetical protein
MKRSLLFAAYAAGLLGLTAPPAQAGFNAADVQWNYSFTPAQPFITADKTTSNPNPGSVTFLSGGNSASGDSYVDLANLRLSSTASPSNPDTFSSNGAWSISMKLTDAATGNSTTLTFTGKLSGTFSKSNSQIGNAFTGQTSQSWTDPANGNTFTVSLATFTPPGPPDPQPVNGVQPPVTYGAISAYVSLTNSGDGNGQTSGGAPEPSTLVLSFMGLAFAGAASWRKHRRLLAVLPG